MRRAISDHVSDECIVTAATLSHSLTAKAAKLDHMTGSTTFVVNIPGALEPLSPPLPEFIKAYVYAPGTVIREIEREGRENPVPDIVQMIIRELGVSTVGRFDRARKRLWSFPVNGSAPRPRPLPDIDGMPDPIPEGSARYTIYGRRLRTQPDPISYFAIGRGTPTIEDDEDIGADDYSTIDTLPRQGEGDHSDIL